MRYFARIAYNGARFYGWQRQPGQDSVQQHIEGSLSLILRTDTAVTGCGRTDTGVHAEDYVLHFDYDGELPHNLLYRINRLLPPGIAFFRIAAVHDAAHARFDAVSRTYEYYMTAMKDPFRQETVWVHPFFDRLDRDLLQQAAAVLPAYDQFLPFCKTNTDTRTMICHISESSWSASPGGDLVYRVTADRFLRGMVRLIVGMCVEVALGHTSLDEVHDALTRQVPLRRSHSVPPTGLFLKDIHYSYF